MAEDKSSGITMYSTSWCPDCVRAKMVFRRLKVDFVEVDVDKSREGYRIVMEHNNGKRIVPTIFFPDGSVLVEPSNQALKEKFEALGLAQLE
jgi:glutaredoxin